VNNEDYPEHDYQHDHKNLWDLLDAKKVKLLFPEKPAKVLEKHEHRRRLLANTHWVELFLVNDKSRIDAKGGNADQAFQNSVHIANLVDSLYMMSNLNPPVEVVLTTQWAFPDEDPWAATMVTGGAEVDHKRLLEDFHVWREQIRLSENLRFDNGQLLSHLDFEVHTCNTHAHTYTNTCTHMRIDKTHSTHSMHLLIKTLTSFVSINLRACMNNTTSTTFRAPRWAMLVSRRCVRCTRAASTR
jgi:hypothetical protein